MIPQKIPNSQSNLGKEEQSLRHHTSWFQTILQSYSNQNSMVLRKKRECILKKKVYLKSLIKKMFCSEKAMAPHSSTLAWKIPWTEEPGRLQSMGSRRVGHDWGLHFHFSLSCIGEGNGNPLQCSCLENPRDGGAWWAAVSGVAQSQTWLKRLSSSSSRSEKWRLCIYLNTYYIYLIFCIFYLFLATWLSRS